MIEFEIEHEERPRHRLEIKKRGHLDNIREGPYITHNVLITHADFLKSTNKDKDLTLYRIFPTGGGYNYIGDIVALVTWYFVVVFIVASIPIACYCENKVINIANAIVLCIILIYHIIALYAVTKNRKKFRRAWFVTETSAEKYMGLQNYFVDVSIDNALELHFVNNGQRQKIITMLSNKQVRSMLLMLCTKSYWRSRVVDPIICLSVTSCICLIGMFVQIITLRVLGT
ncbi:uncharacterized protein LOC127733155 [Mytilus californianus]|uniref:uncharacterized protein LOC127733155 n=1 Tax=Mytilus californianus TaxID=6549 RepID=UPI0022452C2A|nr:uncharacterized protein LOC127733155 [Mytilus californianus]XP_052098464.1 uncharacterized protein LOC127733155 [Mytilus californianus]